MDSRRRVPYRGSCLPAAGTCDGGRLREADDMLSDGEESDDTAVVSVEAAAAASFAAAGEEGGAAAPEEKVAPGPGGSSHEEMLRPSCHPHARQDATVLDIERLEKRLELQRRYQEAVNAKRQRSIQVTEIPRPEKRAMAHDVVEETGGGKHKQQPQSQIGSSFTEKRRRRPSSRYPASQWVV
ncbi:hypothetical protein ACP4OV_003182 [Aristida adscensionis]